ncbi:MAG: cbb3-type cytochrome c oxidase subunit I [Actinomycetota bacterium]|nr:cbb3-type cytochrome c oxidase subunit I [Actinomycetota bacterium]
MTDTQTADNRALQDGGADASRVTATHFMVGAAFLVLGGELLLLQLMSLYFDELFPISYGRLEAMANISLFLGFAVISLVGGAYYVLPRLTGARLWSTDLAWMGLVGMTIMTFVGIITVGAGLGEGRLPFGVPWWFHIPTVFLLALPLFVALGTINNRGEEHSYVTIWFVLGGLTWLPLLYLAYFSGDMPYFSAVATEYISVFFSTGFITMFVFTVGTGLFYYTLVKELDIPLASRQLALVGFWSLGFAAVWWGTAQVLFGPGPDWISGVSAALGLAFPIGALANAVNASLTLEGSWDQVRERPDLRAGVMGLYLAVGVAVLAALAGFRTIASVTSLTAFWEAIEYTAIAGVGALLVAGISYSALPRLLGRELIKTRARWSNTLTLVGSAGVLIFMSASGALSGYSWVGGSNSAAYIDAGEGWAAGLGNAADTLLLIAVFFGIVTFIGQLSYGAAIFGTAVGGKATEQEILVVKAVDDE